MDPVTLEIFRALYTSVAEEMGVSLRRSAVSPNIKERRDYSCAVFDRRARLVAQGDHMPVHLGSMPMSVAAAVAQCPMDAGDIVVLNDPFAGGHIAARHGTPAAGIHALQIEVARTSYCQRDCRTPGPGFERVACLFEALASGLGEALGGAAAIAAE